MNLLIDKTIITKISTGTVGNLVIQTVINAQKHKKEKIEQQKFAVIGVRKICSVSDFLVLPYRGQSFDSYPIHLAQYEQYFIKGQFDQNKLKLLFENRSESACYRRLYTFYLAQPKQAIKTFCPIYF